MKIRSGFVSNSSSASFFVEVNSTKKELCDCLQKGLDNFSVSSFLIKLKFQLKEEKK